MAHMETTPQDSVGKFLAWAEHDRNRSEHTMARYRAVLAQLKDPSAATRDDVETWWATRLHMSPSTRANELACLRAFYKWAIRFDVRPDDPTGRLDAPAIPNRLPRPIAESELTRLFAATEDTPELRRAVALGAYGGMRVSEAAGLDWSNVDQEARRMFIRGKGGKERAFGLSPVLLDKILPDTGGNVVTAGGTPISAATLQRRVNRMIDRCGIEHTFHDLRKRAATLSIARTGDVYAVAKAFGWSSIETASTYAAVSDESLDAIANAVI